MYPWSISIETTAIASEVITEILLFGDQVNHIKTETIDAFICPEMQDLFDFLAHFRVFPVQISLLLTEQMQIVLSTLLIESPGVATEFGLPVIRCFAIDRIAPDVKIAEPALRIAEGGFKPDMFGGGMVEHHIHDDMHVALFTGSDQLFKVSHAAESRINRIIVGNIIAIIDLR